MLLPVHFIYCERNHWNQQVESWRGRQRNKCKWVHKLSALLLLLLSLYFHILAEASFEENNERVP